MHYDSFLTGVSLVERWEWARLEWCQPPPTPERRVRGEDCRHSLQRVLLKQQSEDKRKKRLASWCSPCHLCCLPCGVWSPLLCPMLGSLPVRVRSKALLCCTSDLPHVTSPWRDTLCPTPHCHWTGHNPWSHVPLKDQFIDEEDPVHSHRGFIAKGRVRGWPAGPKKKGGLGKHKRGRGPFLWGAVEGPLRSGSSVGTGWRRHLSEGWHGAGEGAQAGGSKSEVRILGKPGGHWGAQVTQRGP